MNNRYTVFFRTRCPARKSCSAYEFQQSSNQDGTISATDTSQASSNQVLYDVHGKEFSSDRMAITIGDQLVAWRAGRQGRTIDLIRLAIHRSCPLQLDNVVAIPGTISRGQEMTCGLKWQMPNSSYQMCNGNIPFISPHDLGWFPARDDGDTLCFSGELSTRC
jgi:hypothetical protein